MKYELKDWLASINHTKKNLIEDISDESSYNPYVINRCLAGHEDCIFYVNEMNIFPNTSKRMQYSFYLNTLRKRKRFSPWVKKDSITDLDYVKRYYNYSNEKAIQALKLLTKEQLDLIKLKFEEGGTI